MTTERSALANRILELALNRTGKSVEKSAPKNQLEQSNPSVASVAQSPEVVVKQMTETRDNINMMNGILKENQQDKASKKLSTADIERTKQMLQKDISQYNSDIKLLSLLVGRPVSNQDISQLASANLGRATIRSAPVLTSPSTTVFTTVKASTSPYFSSPVPAFKPLTEKETKFLEALEQIQTTKAATTTSTTTERVRPSQSQEALIAALLRQQGIGPNNNQIPIEVSESLKGL